MKKDLTKSKNKQDILDMVDHLIEQNGEVMSVPMIRINQNDRRKLYTCKLTTCFLQALICRLPRNLENPEGIQRALVTKKVSEIQEHLMQGNYGFPNAIVVTLKCNESSFLNLSPLESANNGEEAVAVLTISLRKFRTFLTSCETDEDGYLLSPEKVLLGYMIDGHHRTEGAYVAEQMDYPFPASVYLDLDLRKMAEAFAGINCYQEKPSAIHTNAMRNLSGLMTEEENTAFSLMNDLNSNSGAFYERIKMFDGPRNKSLPRAYVSASKMQSLLEKWLRANVENGFNYSTFSQKAEAIQIYFNAWKMCYPEAWDSSRHVLTKTMGIDILFDLYGILCEFLRSVVLERNVLPDEKDFAEAIHRCFFTVADEEGSAVYQPKSILLDTQSGESIPLNWESATFGALSSGKGINFLKTQLHKMIGITRHECLSE
ncbi:DGQHR domain-containing protein [Anaerolentibacter hominis]|uniref:DGQHR domain-containing protein n=1 Tax=Anaerolentibacter hominis TaxID=3079009 RepID=UPI0031B85E57